MGNGARRRPGTLSTSGGPNSRRARSTTCLSRPANGQLFLLAALPPADLASRYRRRAVWAFLGFLVGVYAVGWLLQGVFG